MAMTGARRWVIVTGAGRGMGFAFAERFLAGDWGVLAMDLSADGLAQLQAAHPDRADALLVAPVDVTDRAAVAAAITESGIGPSLHAAVTAAGIFPPTNLASYTEELFERIMRVNV